MDTSKESIGKIRSDMEKFPKEVVVEMYLELLVAINTLNDKITGDAVKTLK